MIEGALVLALAAAIVKIIGAIYKVPMVAVIGADGNGFYTYAYNIYLVIYSVSVSGFPIAISRIIAGYRAEGRYRDIRKVRRVSTIFLLSVGAVSSVALALLARPYAQDIIHIPRATYAILAVAPSILFSCLMASERGYNQGMSNMAPTAVSQVIEVLFKVAAGLGGAYIARSSLTAEYMQSGTVLGSPLEAGEKLEVVVGSVSAAAAIFGVTISCFAGYIYFLILRAVKGDPVSEQQLALSPEPHCGRDILRAILRFSIPIALSSVTVYLAGLIDGVMIANRLIGVFEEDAATLFASHGGLMELAGKSLADSSDEIANYLYGVYGMGTSLYNLIPSLTGAFGMSSMPHMTKAFVRHDAVSMRREAQSVLRMTMLIASPLGFGLFALAGPITRFLYAGSDPYSAEIAIPMVAVLGIAAVFVAVSSSANSLLQGVGRIDVPVKLMLLGAALKIGINYLFVGIPGVNIRAVPFGNVACYGTMAVLGIMVLGRSAGIKLDLFGSIGKPLIAGALCGVSAKLAYELFTLALPTRTTVGMSVGIAAGAVAYLVALGVLRAIDREDVLSLPAGEKVAAALEKVGILR